MSDYFEAWKEVRRVLAEVTTERDALKAQLIERTGVYDENDDLKAALAKADRAFSQMEDKANEWSKKAEEAQAALARVHNGQTAEEQWALAHEQGRQVAAADLSAEVSKLIGLRNSAEERLDLARIGLGRAIEYLRRIEANSSPTTDAGAIARDALLALLQP